MKWINLRDINTLIDQNIGWFTKISNQIILRFQSQEHYMNFVWISFPNQGLGNCNLLRVRKNIRIWNRIIQNSEPESSESWISESRIPEYLDSDGDNHNFSVNSDIIKKVCDIQNFQIIRIVISEFSDKFGYPKF